MPRNINLKKAKQKEISENKEKDLIQTDKKKETSDDSVTKKHKRRFQIKNKRVEAFLKRKKEEFLKIAYKDNKHQVKDVYIRNTNYAYKILFYIKHSLKVMLMTLLGIIRVCMPVVLPVAGISIILFFMFFITKYSPALQVVMNETPIDIYVKNEEQLSAIRTDVSNAIREAKNGEYAVEQFASLRLVIIDRSEFSSEEEAFDAIYDITAQAVNLSYGIYVDNIFIGCLSRMAEVNRLEDDLLAIATEGQTFDEARLLSSVTYVRGEFPSDSEMTYAQMLMYFRQKTADGSEYLHPVSYEIVTTEITTTRIPAGDPLGVEDPSLYEGFEEIAQTGSDGYVTSEVTITEQNGSEVKRETSVVSRKDPVRGTVRIGTKAIAPSGYFIWPVGGDGGYISSPFGYRNFQGEYVFHRGLDIAADRGTPVYAAEAGTVVFFGWDVLGLGNCVRIDHGNGIYTIYGHCKSLAAGIKVGQRVPQGQVIAYVGMSGSATGNHLHFAMSTSDNFAETSIYIDPLPYLKK